VCVAAALGCSAAAWAADPGPKLRIGIGGDYAFPYRFVPSAFLGVSVPLTKELWLGGRIGGFSASNTTTGGFFDLDVRYMVTEMVYVGAVGGPWYVIDGGSPLRIHAAAQVGVQLGPLSFGLEGGWLQSGPTAPNPSPYLPQSFIAGARLGLAP
jgi:hypothetical protein